MVTEIRVKDVPSGFLTNEDKILVDGDTSRTVLGSAIPSENYTTLKKPTDLGPILNGSITGTAASASDTVYTTSADHDLDIGNTVTTSGMPNNPGGVIISKTNTTFTIAHPFVSNQSGTYTADVIRILGAPGEVKGFLMEKSFSTPQQVLVKDGVTLVIIGHNSQPDLITYTGDSPSLFRFDNARAIRVTEMGFANFTNKKFNEGKFDNDIISFFTLSGCALLGFAELPFIEDVQSVTSRENFYVGFTNALVLKNVADAELTRESFITFFDAPRTYVKVIDTIGGSYSFVGVRMPGTPSEQAFDMDGISASTSVKITGGVVNNGILFGTINQKDPRVIVRGTTGIPDSQIAGGFFASGAITITTLTGTYTDLIFPATRTPFSYNERINYAGLTNGEIEVTTREMDVPLDIPLTITADPSANGDVSILVKALIDKGAGYVDLPDIVESELFFKGTPTTTEIRRRIVVNNGNKIKFVAKEGNVGSTNIEITSGDVMV